MRKISILLFVSAIFICSSLAFAQDSGNNPATRVIAYYFHGSFRCATCHKLEQYSKEAIEINFQDALASGKLEFKAVNVEDRGNEHYSKDYQLYTKSLILSLVKDGKEIKWKNMDKIWEYVSDKKRFFDYVNEEVNNFLKEAS
ncbi:MAG: nitrophenyl compound nitroreductase subunit ArsF family protein [Candidatus Omnitrophica bacterium]|nr:nitrophenyl compound nitroreductase subunit ArsF family protein [Candidatus Omnitrophota bacterium]